MKQTGIYEQLITQLVEQNLDRESFYVGERSLDIANALVLPLYYMSKIDLILNQ